MSIYKKQQENGFVAIIVASILMVIMTLITIGFTQIMQREQRQALDRQLSTQAYYAAESAINDFYVALQASYADPDNYSFPNKEKTNCSTDEFPAIDGGRLDGEGGDISYTCLQYDLDPETIELNNGSIETDQSKVIPIRLSDNSGGNTIQQITLGWEHQDGIFGLAGETICGPDQNNFPSSRPESVPIMRVDLLRLPRSGSGQPIIQQELIDETLNLYLSPKSGCGVNTTNFSEHNEPAEKGKIIQVNCASNPTNTTNRQCQLEINIDLEPRRTDRYVMRLRSIYANANATISARDTLTIGGRTELIGAQVLVDATGKANDVVRRVQVRLQAIERRETEYSIPEPVFQAMEGFCKVLTVTPPGSEGVSEGRVNLNSSLCNP